MSPSDVAGGQYRSVGGENSYAVARVVNARPYIIQNKWYSTKYFEKNKQKNLSLKTFALLLFKFKVLHNKI